MDDKNQEDITSYNYLPLHDSRQKSTKKEHKHSCHLPLVVHITHKKSLSFSHKLFYIQTKFSSIHFSSLLTFFVIYYEDNDAFDAAIYAILLCISFFQEFAFYLGSLYDFTLIFIIIVVVHIISSKKAACARLTPNLNFELETIFCVSAW